MMGDVTAAVACEITADTLRTAAHSRSSRMPTPVVGAAAMRRQRSHVLHSLLLVAHRRESAATEAE